MHSLDAGLFWPHARPRLQAHLLIPAHGEGLLRGFAGGDWIERANFSALRKVPAEYIGDDLRKRLGDSLWRLPLDEGWLHVMVLLEFQARNERDMALRILEYTAMLYRELSRAGLLGPDGLRPPVLPIVLYNGGPPWSAATDVRDLVAQAGPEGLDLEDMRMTLEEMSLEERVAEWPKQWLQEGMEKGLEQGLEQGREQGLEQGLERGIEQGLQRERALLRRQVRLRFGAGAAEQAAQRLERIADANRLEEVGELIVRCETEDEFLARMGA